MLFFETQCSKSARTCEIKK